MSLALKLDGSDTPARAVPGTPVWTSAKSTGGACPAAAPGDRNGHPAHARRATKC